MIYTSYLVHLFHSEGYGYRGSYILVTAASAAAAGAAAAVHKVGISARGTEKNEKRATWLPTTVGKRKVRYVVTACCANPPSRLYTV